MSAWRMLPKLMGPIVLWAVALFGSAGTLGWPMGWAFILTVLVSTVVSRLFLFLRNPGLVSERARFMRAEGAKRWDLALVPVIVLIGPLVQWIVAGLDYRFGWSPAMAPALQVAGLAVLALGYALSTWAMFSNPFFAAVVRIQKERGHTVVSGGPYRYVRHPGYAGGILGNLATAIALGSLWALVPTAVVALLTILRTALEDRTLRQELEGYEAYAQRVRYRLLPGVW